MKRRIATLIGAVVLLTSVADLQAFYNPGTGRWINRDPIGEHGGLNNYGVVSNCPVSLVDADGRQGYSPWPGHPPITFPPKPKERHRTPPQPSASPKPRPEVGFGGTCGLGGHWFALGGQCSVSATITTKCRLCVTISTTIRVGPGLAIHAGVGGAGTISRRGDLEGCNITVGLGAVYAEGTGFSGGVEGNIDGGGMFAGRGDVGAGFAAGVQASINCTGCAPIWYGPAAQVVASYRALKFMRDSTLTETFKESFGL
jgi:hypothetical protein